MQHVPVEETFDLVRECFPEVDCSDLIKFRDHVTAFKLEDVGFVLACPYNYGYVIQYMGVKESARSNGYATEMLRFISLLAGARTMYAEVQPDSAMYNILIKAGWVKVPIPYVCPAWGNEAPDYSRCLMTTSPHAEHLLFVSEFYQEGYKNPSQELIEQYTWELRMHDYTPVWEQRFKELFAQCFHDDILTIVESIDRAKLRLVSIGDKLVGFMLYNPYADIHSVVVEYVGVDQEMRRNHVGKWLFTRLMREYIGWSLYGEVHRDTAVTKMLQRMGWCYSKVNWVCPAWGDIPEDTSRSLIMCNSTEAKVPVFAKAFYDYGYGVSRDDIVAKYEEEVRSLVD